MTYWLACFVLTVAIELPIALALAPRAFRRHIALDALLANLLTHPAAWFLVGEGLLDWGVTEGAIAFIEGLVYAAVTRLSWSRATGIALAANAVSAASSFVV